jgi:hypothetical protein
MFERMSVWRLRHFANECRRGHALASDPLTQRELAEFEAKFRELASDVEAAQNNAAGRS